MLYSRSLLAALALLGSAACLAPHASAPTAPLAPHLVAIELHLLGPIPAACQLRVTHESGLALAVPLPHSGICSLSLPPGPCTATLSPAVGAVREFVFVVHERGERVRWQLPQLAP